VVRETPKPTYSYRPRTDRDRADQALKREAAHRHSGAVTALIFVVVSLAELSLARILMWGTAGTALGFFVDAAFLLLLAIAIALLPKRHQLTGQLPLLAAMIGFTVSGLYLLFAA